MAIIRSSIHVASTALEDVSARTRLVTRPLWQHITQEVRNKFHIYRIIRYAEHQQSIPRWCMNVESGFFQVTVVCISTARWRGWALTANEDGDSRFTAACRYYAVCLCCSGYLSGLLACIRESALGELKIKRRSADTECRASCTGVSKSL